MIYKKEKKRSLTDDSITCYMNYASQSVKIDDTTFFSLFSLSDECTVHFALLEYDYFTRLSNK